MQNTNTSHYTVHKSIAAAQQGLDYSFTDIVLPLSPMDRDTLEAKVCQKFVQHLRHVRSNHMTMKILASIQYTSDMLDCSDAHVSKILVDYGLRAPRESFPETFVTHVDACLQKTIIEAGSASWSYIELNDHWIKQNRVN